MLRSTRSAGAMAFVAFAILGPLALPVLAQDVSALPAVAQAVTTPAAVSAGDTAWVLVSAALVLMMTPALAFFYGGLVRRKNMLSVLMQCFTLMALITVQWVLFGYSLAFGPDKGGWIGSLAWHCLNGVGLAPNADYASTIPHQAFMIYQAMFAIITPGLILGAFAERMKFSSFCVFSLLWATIVYDPVAHWIWGAGGFLHAAGALDFAGGAVVHVNAGMAALAAALVMGQRTGFPHRMSPPHNLPLAVLGAGLLWFGWFGFNAGSALSSGTLSTTAFVATHVAAASAGLGWAVLDYLYNRHATMLGMITGAVAGLVAITPAAGFVTPMGALGIGLSSSLICYLSVTFMKPFFGYDDSLDAFGVHGIGGLWGAIVTGVWATKMVNPAGADGLLYGNPGQLLVQIKATLIVAVYSLVASWILLKLVDLMLGLRVDENAERLGLDLAEHREAAYTLID